MSVVTKPSFSDPVELLQHHPVAEQAERSLRESGYNGLRHLRCEWDDGVVTIVGRVNSYFLKQMAQTLVARVKGVIRVDNRVRVC